MSYSIVNTPYETSSVTALSASGIYAPINHTHAISGVTGLQTELDSKQASGDYATTLTVSAVSASLQSQIDSKQASGDYVKSVNYQTPDASGNVNIVVSGGTSTFESPIVSAGDLIVGNESGSAVRLPIGNDNQVLTVSAGSIGWSDAPSGGTGASINDTVVALDSTWSSAKIQSELSLSVSAIPVGAIIQSPVTIDRFLLCDGSKKDKTVYSALYSVIGNSVDLSGFNNGKPWSQQYLFNTAQSGDITGWASSGTLPGNLAWSSPVVTKNRVYLLGGYSGGNVTTVYTAPISADGSLGDWTTGTALPTAVAAGQAFATDSRVYLIGATVTYTAPISADGTLGAWATGPTIPTSVYGSQLIVIKNRIYMLGGNTSLGSGFNSIIYTAAINPDGTLGDFTTAGNLPANIGWAQAVVTFNRVYLMGGYTGAALSAVYTTSINEDGTLGTWAPAISLPAARGGARLFATKNMIYLIGGGLSSSTVTNTVYTAPVLTDGTIGNWSAGTTLPGVLGYTSVIVTSSRIFLIGGSVAGYTASTNIIYSAPISGGFNDYSNYTKDSLAANEFYIPKIARANYVDSYIKY